MLILIVEDDTDFAEIICGSIKKWGHQAILAKDGEEAVKLIKAHKFDIIFSDLAIPKLSGDKLLKYFREIDRTTTFYIMSGFNDKLDENNLDVNTKILNKPFRLKQLKQILDECS